jgi:hypothetical protein
MGILNRPFASFDCYIHNNFLAKRIGKFKNSARITALGASSILVFYSNSLPSLGNLPERKGGLEEREI